MSVYDVIVVREIFWEQHISLVVKIPIVSKLNTIFRWRNCHVI